MGSTTFNLGTNAVAPLAPYPFPDPPFAHATAVSAEGKLYAAVVRRDGASDFITVRPLSRCPRLPHAALDSLPAEGVAPLVRPGRPSRAGGGSAEALPQPCVKHPQSPAPLPWPCCTRAQGQRHSPLLRMVASFARTRKLNPPFNTSPPLVPPAGDVL